MKKVIKNVIGIVVMAALLFGAFVAGVVYEDNHGKKTLTVTTSVRRVDETTPTTDVVEVDDVDSDMESELMARRILGNDVAEELYKYAYEHGELWVDQRRNGELICSTMIPVCEGRTEWGAVARFATNHYRGTEYTVETV